MARAPPPTKYLSLPEGRLAYDDTGGSGPLVVCAPGIGDLRSQYRFLAPALAAAGMRVVTVDLRGNGESDATFSKYNGEEVGKDLVALLEHLDTTKAALVGNSLAAGAAVYAAAEAPARVRALVLLGPFVRGPDMGAGTKLLLRLVFATRHVRDAAWPPYYKSLVKSPPPDFEEHARAMAATLRSDPRRSKALAAMALADHKHAEVRLGKVGCPVLVVMGAGDPDFPDPAKEAREVASLLRGRALVVEGAGHYPHFEKAEEVAAEVVPFLKEAK